MLNRLRQSFAYRHFRRLLGGIPTCLNNLTAQIGFTVHVKPARIDRWFPFRKPTTGPAPNPPELPDPYTMHHYDQFLKKETFLYTESYVRRFVAVHRPEILLDAVSTKGAIMASLHYGSYMLAGGAIKHLLGIPFAAMVGFDDLEPRYVRDFWLGVGIRSSRLYGQPHFQNNGSPRKAIRWLETKGNVLGMAIDAPANGRHWHQKPCNFLDRTIHMQTGTARLACIAGVPMVPATIQYDPLRCQHQLYFDEPVYPDGDSHSMTQRVLNELGKHVARVPQQQHYDIVKTFQSPPNPDFY